MKYAPCPLPMLTAFLLPLLAQGLVAQDSEVGEAAVTEVDSLPLNVNGAITMALGSNLELALSAVQTEVSRYDELGSSNCSYSLAHSSRRALGSR